MSDNRQLSLFEVNTYKVGDWIRFWADWNRLSTSIGQITGRGEADNNWHIGQFVWIENAQSKAAVRDRDIIERIDPVAEWERLRPGEPVPAWLERRLSHPGSDSTDD